MTSFIAASIKNVDLDMYFLFLAEMVLHKFTEYHNRETMTCNNCVLNKKTDFFD